MSATRTTALATPDPTQCARCGQVHRCRRHGDPGCTGHLKRHDPDDPLEPCGNCRMQGQTVCRMHGGSAGQTRRAASKRLALASAVDDLTALGVAVEVDPAEAMLAMVWEAAGNVAFLRARVQELRQEVIEPAPVDPDDEGGPRWAPDGIAGPTGSTTKANEAAPHVLVVMYDAERERLVKWAKACRDAGVEEHRVRLAESQGAQLADVLRGVTGGLLAVAVAALEAAGVDPGPLRAAWQESAPVIVAGEIERVAGPDAGGTGGPSAGGVGVAG